MENVIYVKHKFGKILFKKRLKRFIESFKLISMEDIYYRNSKMIVRIEGKYLVVLTNNTELDECKNKIYKYFYK